MLPLALTGAAGIKAGEVGTQELALAFEPTRRSKTTPEFSRYKAELTEQIRVEAIWAMETASAA